MRNIFLVSSLLLLMNSVAFGLDHNQTNKNYGPVRPHDHLWQIALKTRPSDTITPQQMMIALYQRNQEAFRDGNINGLYQGASLTMPTTQDIKRIQPSNAIMLVANQNSQWQSPDKTTTPTSGITAGDKLSAMLNQKYIRMENDVSMLASQIQQFLFESSERVASISENQAVMHEQIVAMAQTIRTLTDQVETEKAALTALNKNSVSNQSIWEKTLQNYAVFGIAAIGFVLLLIIMTWVKFLRTKQSASTTFNIEMDAELEDEYDFINSEEGIAAKLDLAQAYIDMDDVDTAKTTLDDVLKRGNKEQQRLAQELMSQIITTA